MARTVSDTALMLSAIAGPDPRASISLPEPSARFRPPLGRGALHGDGGGSDGEGGEGVRSRLEPATGPDCRSIRASAPSSMRSGRRSNEFGCHVEDGEPDLTGATEVFATWRAWYFELCYGSLLDEHRDRMKKTVVWNIEEGRRLSGPRLAAAARDWTALLDSTRRFMERFRFLVLPVAQVPPFDVEQEYPTAIDGVAMNTYVDWMGSCSVISVLGLPAISVPGGFTGDGLPIGIQIVGRQHDDLAVLQLAHAFEQSTRVGECRPPL